MLLAAIDENHRGTYDFLYLPIDFKVFYFCRDLIVLFFNLITLVTVQALFIYLGHIIKVNCLFELSSIIFSNWIDADGFTPNYRISATWVMPSSIWCLLLTLSPSTRLIFVPFIPSHLFKNKNSSNL